MSPSKKTGKKASPVRKTSKAEPATAVLDIVPPPATARIDSPKAGQQQEGRYVYGVIESRSPVGFGRSNIGGVNEDVYTVHYGDIAAVVSRTPVFIFDPTRDNALAHEHVIESVMKNYTIIPMSFGTVFRTDDDIREVLQSFGDQFR